MQILSNIPEVLLFRVSNIVISSLLDLVKLCKACNLLCWATLIIIRM